MEDVSNLPQIKKALAEARPVTGIQFDSDIMGATKGQADLLLRGIPTLTPETVDKVIEVVISIGVKLSSLRYHSKHFRQAQELRKREIEADEKIKGIITKGMVISEKEMIFEFEAYLFQLKSALDMLVKLFVPIFGSKQTDISTYGKAGEKVITYLHQLKKNKKKKLTHSRIDLLIELITQARDPWLKPLIALRDTSSHYASHIRIGFGWDAVNNEVRQPMVNVSGTEYPLIEVMEREAEHLVDFSSHFIAGTILCAVPVTTYYQPLEEMEKKYIGALWGIDMSRATLKLSSNVIFNYTENDIEEANKIRLKNKAKLLGEG